MDDHEDKIGKALVNVDRKGIIVDEQVVGIRDFLLEVLEVRTTTHTTTAINQL